MASEGEPRSEPAVADAAEASFREAADGDDSAPGPPEGDR